MSKSQAGVAGAGGQFIPRVGVDDTFGTRVGTFFDAKRSKNVTIFLIY